VHCERGFRRVTLPLLEFDGSVAHWFPWWRKYICEPLLISLCTSMLFAAFSVSQPDAVALLTRLAGLRW
jgi:hypothetical protein